MKEQLYSARYFILTQMPEGKAKTALLNMLRPILGPEPPQFRPGDPEPVPAPDLEEDALPGVPAEVKVALIVGHNSSAPGAWLKPPISESEFTFWNKVVDIAIARGIPHVELRKFNRTATRRGYAAEIDACYREVNRWGPHLYNEMHFNGGNGDYSFILAGTGRKDSVRIASAGQDVWAESLGLRNLGVRQRKRSERGGRSLFAGKAPGALTEPFFGDNREHAELIGSLGHEKVADILIETLKAQIKELYRVV